MSRSISLITCNLPKTLPGEVTVELAKTVTHLGEFKEDDGMLNFSSSPCYPGSQSVQRKIFFVVQGEEPTQLNLLKQRHVALIGGKAFDVYLST